MKEQILEIAEKLRLELITEYEAETLLLCLFSVSWRSEQLLDFVRWQNRQSRFIIIPETMVTDYEKYLEYVGGKK